MPTKNILAFHTTTFFSILRSNIYNYFLSLSFNYHLHIMHTIFLSLYLLFLVNNFFFGYMIFHTKSICTQIKINVDKIFNQVISFSSNGFKLSGFAIQMQNENANFYFAFYLIMDFCNIYHCMGFVKIQTVMMIKHW